jgi:putative PIG3 family NAD(P)H quinone oxidoreductase
MLAVAPFSPSSSPTVRLIEVPRPVPGVGEILVRVRAAALNRADLLQMRGLYPPPAGEPEIPGLEASGEVVALGQGATRFEVGDRVAALLAGGGHAEFVAVPDGQAFGLWPGASFADGAALPEAAITSWVNLVSEGHLRSGQAVVITGANGGIGSFAVQLARELGALVLAVVRRADARRETLEALGASEVLDASADWPTAVRRATGGRGADLAIDFVGGSSTARALASLASGGRCILLGVIDGARAELDLAELLRRRLRLHGSTLRGRSRAEKAALVGAFFDFAGVRLATGALRPVIDRVLPFDQLPAAYAQLAAGVELGKIVAVVD